MRFTGDEVMRWEDAIWGKIKIGQGWVFRGIVDGMRGRLFNGVGPEGRQTEGKLGDRWGKELRKWARGMKIIEEFREGEAGDRRLSENEISKTIPVPYLAAKE